jgi:aminoglycoside phosphotransferase (APT) family kinase protein
VLSLASFHALQEFAEANWTASEEDASDIAQWQENWDDDTVDEDFCALLRKELEATAPKQQSATSSKEA